MTCRVGTKLAAIHKLLGASVLGHSLGTLRHGMFGQLSRKEETHSSLDLTRCDCGPLVVVCQLAGLRSNPLKQVVHEGIHDRHGFGGDTSVRVNLLQHLVDVDCVRLLPLALPFLLVPFGNSLGGLARLGTSFTRSLGRHCEDLKSFKKCYQAM